MNYLAVMSAVKSNNLVINYLEEPKTEWWELVKAHKKIEFRELPEDRKLRMVYGDHTGQLDIIYLREFTNRTIDDAFIRHEGLYQSKDIGEFEINDMDLIKVHLPEGEENFDFLTVDWVKTSGTLLAELIQTVLLRRVWNPYERQ